MGTSDLEAQIANLKLEYAAESERVQVLERHLDALLRKNEVLESSLARTRALLAVAMSDSTKAADASAPDVSGALPRHQQAGASALAEALLKLLRSELPPSTPSAPAATEASATPAETPASEPTPEPPVPEVPAHRPLALRAMHMRRHAGDQKAPSEFEVLVQDAFAVPDIWTFAPLDETSHRSVLVRSQDEGEFSETYSAVRISFLIRMTGYVGLIVEYRADSAHQRHSLEMSTAPWKVLTPENSGRETPPCHVTQLDHGWARIELSLNAAGDQFPEIAFVPVSSFPYRRSEGSTGGKEFAMELGAVALEFLDGAEPPGRLVVTHGAMTSARPPAAAPFVPHHVARLPDPAILKGKKLSPARAAAVQQERQAQMDAFALDGSLAEIEKLAGIHKGKRCFIIGNGPSLAQQDLSKLRGEVTFVANWFANHPAMDAIRPSYYAISSHEMFGGWGNPDPQLNEGFLSRLTSHSYRPEMFFSHRFKSVVENTLAPLDYRSRHLIFDRPKFLADEAGGLEYDIAQPMHDGYTVLLTFCIPLAVHMGITEIYMVGCDCDYGVQTEDEPRKYFYAPDLHTTSSTKIESINRIWGENGPLFKVYEQARDHLAERGVQIYNATAGGKLEVLTRVDYDSVLSESDSE